jgi:enterochelin esterase family protein
MKPANRCFLPLAACALAASLAAAPGFAQERPLSPRELDARLLARPSGAAADQLANALREWFGAEALKRGPAPKVDETVVAWAIELPEAGPLPHVVSLDGKFDLSLTRVGETAIYAGVAWLEDGDAMRSTYQVGDRRYTGLPRTPELEVYRTHPDGRERPGVPKGTVKQMPRWESKIFAGTTRDWWVYVPAQYTPDKPACVMVFQDGAGPKSYVPTIFDNLIAAGDIPVTVGIFIQPGSFAGGRPNRSFEYDTLSDQYARFLLEEILPEVEKEVKLRHDPESRAISGASSGGICAFTVAWERPKEFSKVLSWVGSFTNIANGASGRAGGHNYAAMIRKSEIRPIRVFLQDGENDLDNNNGNWPLANLELAKSLAFMRYDHKLVMGKGFHSGRHGQAILPDSLRWLWRGYRPPSG